MPKPSKTTPTPTAFQLNRLHSALKSRHGAGRDRGAFLEAAPLKGRRIWSYARYSKPRQKGSEVNQREMCRAYITTGGGEWDDGRFIIDPATSRKTRFCDREGGAWLLASVEPGDVLVVWNLTRLGCNMEDVFNTFLTLAEMDVEIHVLEFNGMTINISSSLGKMFLSIMVGFSAMQREFIADSTADAKAVHRVIGKPIGSYPPKGFRYITDPNTGKRIKAVPDYDERKLIREIVQRRQAIADAVLAGKKPEESIKDIENDLRRRHYKRKGGKLWDIKDITRLWEWWNLETHDAEGNLIAENPWEASRIEEDDIEASYVDAGTEEVK